jgi:hypothetical protein
MIVPIKRMEARYEGEKDDSDVSAFYGLMFFGELLTKMTVCTFLAGFTDDRDRNRYGLLRELVRADGIGEWSSRLDAALTGPSAQFLRSEFKGFQRELLQRTGDSEWQYEAVRLLHHAIQALQIEIPNLPPQLPLRQWFTWFALLRNKTRGHGAPLSIECSRALTPLEQSIRLLAKNLSIFQAEWAYLHRNLSGKYKVTALSETSDHFKHFRETRAENLPDGVYIHLGTPVRIELFESDSSITDFFVPNGQFRNTDYEVISYITNQKHRADGTQWLAPATPLPSSETQGSPALDLQGNSLSNVPVAADDYIDRPNLEKTLETALTRDRHEIVSLGGPGGIGKTSLAISVIKKLQAEQNGRFDLIVWFSARDIDLLSSGPKPVRPHGVSLSDFANEYAALMQPANRGDKGFKTDQYFAAALSGTPLGPTLYVFDNFETVTNPAEVFAWIDTYIRNPNKVLITTRTRDFVGDYPINVAGMTDSEALRLIDAVAKRIDISDLLTDAYRRTLIDESSGHPYVIKILLGEISKAQRLIKPQRIIADQDQILQALFERTYSALSPAAQRVFLLLSTWRSVIPAIALEAVLMRSAEERIDVRGALDELRRLSFLEEHTAPNDKEHFVSIPLAALTFGQKKLNASPLKAVIEADSELLRDFGTIRKDGVAAGVHTRVAHLVRALAKRLTSGSQNLESLKPMLEFVASRVPAAWPDIARLYLEEGGSNGPEWAKSAYRRYLESDDASPLRLEVWRSLAGLCRESGDIQGEMQALAELSNSQDMTTDDRSELANAINHIFANAARDGNDPFLPEERRHLVGNLIAQLERDITKLDATDLSRLAWLHMHTKNVPRALELAERGLTMDTESEHCRKIIERLRR